MTTSVRPPPPYNCRRPPPPPASLIEPFEDELVQRLQLHAMADAALKGVVPPTDRTHYPPSFRLYTPNYRLPSRDARSRDACVEVWRSRWFSARVLDAQYLPLSALLSWIGSPLLCRSRRETQPLAWAVGSEVHRRIMERYRAEYPDDTVVYDGVVFFPDGTTEQLSQLALRHTRSVFGGLNYCLAGQRCDIINISTGEFWEIKPAALTSADLLQLWGYVDNYEVARVLAYYRNELPLPRIDAGDPATLPRWVTEPFELAMDSNTTLEITPFVQGNLPGLIAYDARAKTRRRRPEKARARQAVSVTSADVEQALILARRNLQAMLEVQDAETKRLLVWCGLLALIVAAVAGEAAVAAEAEAELAAAAGEIVSIAAAAGPAAGGISAPVIAQYGPKIAASVTLYVAGRQFRVPPETAGICVRGGCEIGEASTPGLPAQ